MAGEIMAKRTKKDLRKAASNRLGKMGSSDSLKDRAKIKANITDPDAIGPAPPTPQPVGPQGPARTTEGNTLVNWRGVYSDDIEYIKEMPYSMKAHLTFVLEEELQLVNFLQRRGTGTY